MGFKNPCQNHVGTVSEPCWEHGTGSGLSRPVPTQNHTDPFSFRPVPTRNHSTAAATSHTCLHHFQFTTRDFPVMGEILLGFCLHVAIKQEILAVVCSTRLTRTADKNLVHGGISRFQFRSDQSVQAIRHGPDFGPVTNL